MVEARPARTGAAAAGRGQQRSTSRNRAAQGGAAARGRGRGAAAASTTPGRGGATAGRGAAASGRGGAKILGAQRDDYECPVCLELCAQPVLTPCKHFMCFQCHKRVVEAGMTCPMCRAHFDKLFIPQVDKDL